MDHPTPSLMTSRDTDCSLGWNWNGLLVLTIASLFLQACHNTSNEEVDLKPVPVTEWQHYGNDPGGSRYSPLDQITRENVGQLREVWRYHTGDLTDDNLVPPNIPAFEATPLLIDETLYLCSPRSRIIALDATTGEERWTFEPEADTRGHYLVTCRGVSHDYWPEKAGQQCARRIYAATVDARLFALDADTGAPCQDFGEEGSVDLTRGLGPLEGGDYSITSPATVVDHKLILGGLVLDNQSVDSVAGVVRAFDAHTGALLWAWNPHPDPTEAHHLPVGEETYARSTPNAWTVFSVDEQLGLVFVPTGNAPPDFFGGLREGLDHYSSSIVALDIETGRVEWHFQTVHHDLWDYDLASQPVLLDLPAADGEMVPALIQPTKMGRLFALDRRTGTPIYPVEEEPVPQQPVPGEYLSATQPIQKHLPALHPQKLSEEDMWGFTPLDRRSCVRAFRKYRYEGPYTPPSTQGTINYPGTLGGSNWGSVAVHPEQRILVGNTSRLPMVARLIPREEADHRESMGETLYHPQRGTPYAVDIFPLLSPLGAPCNAPPWGALTAIDLVRGEVLWETTLGTTQDLAPAPLWLHLGAPNTGGPLISDSQLVFIGAAADGYLRAFDLESGEELWRDRLPAGGQATPMTYRVASDPRQFVVISAGGHAHLGSRLGDAVVAYALPAKQEP